MDIHKVLLVDDEEDIRAVGELSLNAVGGWEVVLASSGPDALRLAVEESPDVILLDVMMPGMDGPSTLKKLREVELLAKVPILFLTAKVQRAEVEHYLSLGANGVISKPFDPMRLPDDVRNAVTL